jgi:hypothetical protein
MPRRGQPVLDDFLELDRRHVGVRGGDNFQEGISPPASAAGSLMRYSADIASASHSSSAGRCFVRIVPFHALEYF